MALSIDGGEKAAIGILPSSSSRMTLLRRITEGILIRLVPFMVTISSLTSAKREGRKIVAVVLYDYQMAQIVDRAGVDIVSVGDSVGVNMWAQASELDVTLDQMLLVCRAVRRGVKNALV